MTTVTIRDEQGVKTQVQKRHLVMTIKETHALLKADLGMDHPIGKSKFGDLRPWHVLFMQDIPANTCVCQHHENPNLLLGALNWQLMLTLPAFQTFSTRLERHQCRGQHPECHT